MYDVLTLNFDGGMRGKNPGGVPTYGFVVRDREGTLVGEGRGELPGLPPEEATNNTAEWEGLCAGLAFLAALPGPVDCVLVRGDSKLVIHGFRGEWAMRKPHLQLYRRRALALAKALDVGHLDVAWVPRTSNSYADSLTR